MFLLFRKGKTRLKMIRISLSHVFAFGRVPNAIPVEKKGGPTFAAFRGLPQPSAAFRSLKAGRRCPPLEPPLIIIDWQTGRLADWQTGRLADWETGRLGDWRLGDWETGRLGDWRLGDWETSRLADWETGSWEIAKIAKVAKIAKLANIANIGNC